MLSNDCSYVRKRVQELSFLCTREFKFFFERGNDNRSCLEKKEHFLLRWEIVSHGNTNTVKSSHQDSPETTRWEKEKKKERKKNTRDVKNPKRNENAVVSREVTASKNASSSARRRKRNACTHTRVQPVFHVFTLGRVAAGVTCARLHTRTQANTEAARWRLSATQMCMRAWRVYTSLSCARPRVRKYAVCTYTRAQTRTPNTLRRVKVVWRVCGCTSDLVSFWQSSEHKNEGNFVPLAERPVAESNEKWNRLFGRRIFRIIRKIEDRKIVNRSLLESIANFPFTAILYFISR